MCAAGAAVAGRGAGALLELARDVAQEPGPRLRQVASWRYGTRDAIEMLAVCVVLALVYGRHPAALGLVEPADVDHDHADAVVERSQRLLYGPERL